LRVYGVRQTSISAEKVEGIASATIGGTFISNEGLVLVLQPVSCVRSPAVSSSQRESPRELLVKTW
jgi:hypothetical protein